MYLSDLAEVIRSKNAGPYELTLDIIFRSDEIYEKVVSKKLITVSKIAQLYRIPESQIISVVEFAPARAIKATMVRPTASGDIGDTDIYGAQQHAPLLNWEFDWK
ncbi:hypothetical protein Psfp_01433 [Pelotomaculum sp. FP]|nr:hypothetical protein Psfp_01433 [Pelotomaculum sp. FP]